MSILRFRQGHISTSETSCFTNLSLFPACSAKAHVHAVAQRSSGLLVRPLATPATRKPKEIRHVSGHGETSGLHGALLP